MYGHSVPDHLDEVRDSVGMGVCPQHNTLYPDLTVTEHLQLFAGLKVVPAKEVVKAVAETIATIGLVEKVRRRYTPD